MPGKSKDVADKIAVLKGQLGTFAGVSREHGTKRKLMNTYQAEDAVLQYMKKMNRPFGAVDVSANLKGAVPKTATQKILASLAEKGDITQKPYGKTVFYVAKQSDIENVPSEKIGELEAETKQIAEENKQLTEEARKLNSDLGKIKNAPTDDEIARQSKDAKLAIAKTLSYLEPLRTGTSTLLTQEEVAQLEADWHKWRTEWVKRRKAFFSLWGLLSESLSKQQEEELAEDLGIEQDSAEHKDIESGYLCAPNKRY